MPGSRMSKAHILDKFHQPPGDCRHPAAIARQVSDHNTSSAGCSTILYADPVTDHEDWTPGDVVAIAANPFYAINIDEGLALPHEPMLSEDDWIRTNVKLVADLGPESYLRNLLSILKGNYPR